MIWIGIIAVIVSVVLTFLEIKKTKENHNNKLQLMEQGHNIFIEEIDSQILEREDSSENDVLESKKMITNMVVKSLEYMLDGLNDESSKNDGYQSKRKRFKISGESPSFLKYNISNIDISIEMNGDKDEQSNPEMTLRKALDSDRVFKEYFSRVIDELSIEDLKVSNRKFAELAENLRKYSQVIETLQRRIENQSQGVNSDHSALEEELEHEY